MVRKYIVAIAPLVLVAMVMHSWKNMDYIYGPLYGGHAQLELVRPALSWQVL